jgi:hypothetical protein
MLLLGGALLAKRFASASQFVHRDGKFSLQFVELLYVLRLPHLRDCRLLCLNARQRLTKVCLQNRELLVVLSTDAPAEAAPSPTAASPTAATAVGRDR